MTISLLHATQAVGVYPDDGELDVPQWNEEHAFTMATARMLGRTTSGTGAVEELEAATVRTFLNVADGATANSPNATLLARANHTGTQSADTLTDGTTNKAFLATERTKLSGVVKNILEYGGVGDGSTDNSTALDSAITAVLALDRGGCIYFPAGVYNFTTQVEFPKTAGKTIHIFGDWGGTEILVNNISGGSAAFYVGSSTTAAGGTGFKASNLQFKGDDSTANSAFHLENANGAVFENIQFDTMNAAVLMEDSYGVSFVGCQSLNLGGDTIYSTTACHNLIIDRFKAYNAGVANSGRFLEIAAATDNVVIQNSDFEGCRQVVSMAGGTSFTFRDNYVEYCVTDAFGFSAALYGMSYVGGWLSYGASFNFANVEGGEFTAVTLVDQAVGFASTCKDVMHSRIRTSGTGVLVACATTTISSFSNGSTAGTPAPSYFKDGDGVVHWEGGVNIGVNGDVVFVAPAGYRPINDSYFPGLNSTTNALVSVFIGANGNVVPNSTSGLFVRLDGISYRAA